MRRRLADNFKRVRDRIEAACGRAHRPLDDIRLIPVTKTVEVDVIRTVIENGALDLGESRVQQLVKRASMVKEYLSRRRAMDSPDTPGNPRWHMIGHLQRNKVRQLLPWIHTIHSVDSLRLAEEISNEATRIGTTVPILIEINISGEKSKMGIAVGAASHLIGHVVTMPGLSVTGLMTMAPLVDNPQEVRPYFRRLRELLLDIQHEGLAGPEFKELSMGMSNDFEVAIEEGATMIRVGTALFENLRVPT